MKNLHSELFSWIGENKVTVDALHEQIHEQLDESYEIGDAGIVLNEMIAERLIVVYEGMLCQIVKYKVLEMQNEESA